MSHVSLYRRFRPTKWENVIGQDAIVKTLINQIKMGTVSHAYLFTGTRGTGKTTSAKIFAKAVNCLSTVNGSPCGKCEVCLGLQNPTNMDIIEMDAASNNGVDEIRELRDNIQYPPTVGKYKVYIIDEVHMLTASAFNALLKTLEEPPEHALFILATTEVHKLPQTILSRCLRFDFRLVPKEKLVDLQKKIFTEIGYKFEESALEQIAEHGEGSVRDTLSIADMCMSYAPDKLTLDGVLDVLGASDFDTLSQIAEGILCGDLSSALTIADGVCQRGKGVGNLGKDLTSFFRDIIAFKNIPSYKGGYTDNQQEALKQIADKYDNYRIGRAMDILTDTENVIRYSTKPLIVLESAIVRASELQTDPDITTLLSRVRALETRLSMLETKGIAFAPRVDTSDKPKGESIEEKLLKMCQKEETAPIFKDTEPQTPQKDEQSIAIWSTFLTSLRENNYIMIHRALSTQEDYSLEGTTMVVNIKDMSCWSIVNAESNSELIKNMFNKTFGDVYSLELKHVTNKEDDQRVSKISLVNLFGSKMVDKNTK